ncbi:MAG: CBS domain-containing protein [Candidatus Micrarchaeaceae archaeon]
MTLETLIPKDLVSEAEFHDYKEKVQALIGRLKEAETIVVLKRGAYAGILDDRALATSNVAKLQGIQIGKLATKAPLINANTDFNEALRSFYDSDAKALPFAESGKITGIVKREGIISLLLSLRALPDLKAHEIMVSPVIGIDFNANAAEAIAAMQKKNIGRLLIISNGKPTGIVTKSDLAFALAKPAERLPEMKKEGSVLKGIRIGSISQGYLHTIEYDKGLEDAARQLISKGISSLGVTRDGRIIGLITAKDIIKAAISNASRQIPVYISGLEAYTKENEEVIRSALENIAKKIDKFESLGASAIFATVKGNKSVYEISASLRLGKGAGLHAKASGQMLEETAREAAKRLYNIAKRYKEKQLSGKEGQERLYA